MLETKNFMLDKLKTSNYNNKCSKELRRGLGRYYGRF